MLKFSSAEAAGAVIFYTGSFVYTAGLITCFYHRIRNRKGKTLHERGGTRCGGEAEGGGRL